MSGSGPETQVCLSRVAGSFLRALTRAGGSAEDGGGDLVRGKRWGGTLWTPTHRGQAPLNPPAAHTPGHTHRSSPQPCTRVSQAGQPPRRYAAHLLLCAHEPTDILTDNKLTTAPKRKPEPYRGAQEGGLRDHPQPLSPTDPTPWAGGLPGEGWEENALSKWEQLWSESGGGGWGWISRENKKLPANINKCVAS